MSYYEMITAKRYPKGLHNTIHDYSVYSSVSEYLLSCVQLAYAEVYHVYRPST